MDYLQHISFKAEWLDGWVAKYIANIRFVILLVVSIVVLGLFAYFNLPQRLNPEVRIPIVIVTTVLPGAGPEDIEGLVTIPLETKLRGVSGVEDVTSVSSDNVSVISMEFASTVDRDKARQDAKEAVDEVNNLPEEAEAPVVRALDFEDQPVWQFVVHGGQDEGSLAGFSLEIEERIKLVAGVDRVVMAGKDTQDILVEADQEAMLLYGLNPISLAGAVRQAISAFPAGTVDTSGNSFGVTIDTQVRSVADVRNLIITTGQGMPVKLGEVAKVSIRPKQGQNQVWWANSSQTAATGVKFSVFKTKTADIVQTANKVEAEVEGIAKANPEFRIQTLVNSGDQIAEQFSDLLGEFASTIALVFLCLLLFLGLKQALISLLTVPLTFLSAFMLMTLTGMTINFLSLFAFLLSLGLLVDDTIVVVSAMTTYYKSGRFSPLQTGILVWRDTIVPIWSTTITTIWSFVPLLLSTGIIGEFIKPIPVVVTLTMLSSTAIAVFISLPLMIFLLKPQLPRRVKWLLGILGIAAGLAVVIGLTWQSQILVAALVVYGLSLAVLWRVRHRLKFSIPKLLKGGVIPVEKLAQKYQRLILRILASGKWRRATVVSIVMYSVFAFALLPMGLVRNEFFPKTDEELVYVNLELANGSNLEQTKVKAEGLLERLRQEPGVEFVVGETGQLADLGNGGGGSGSHLASFSLHLPKKDERTISSIELADKLRTELGRNDWGGNVSVVEQSGGPPAGADLQVTLLGDDRKVLEQIADQTLAFLESTPGVVSPQKSITPGTSTLEFVPDDYKLAEFGLSRQALGLALRSYASGFQLGELRLEEGSEKTTEIWLVNSSQRSSLAEVADLKVSTQFGEVGLGGLGSWQLAANPTQITRKDGQRTVTISAGAGNGFSAGELNAKLQEHIGKVELPEGYAWETGGVNEENQRSVNSILQAMALAFLLILVTMVVQFRSFRQAVIVLLVIPLAVSSVFVIFALTGTPLSFPALIGVLSLFGIVVTNSMFIVDKINLNLKEGMQFTEAIAEAGASRMEPIILTKLSTVLGLLPITIADPLWRGLGGAIISGLLIASTIMLLFIPVVYYSWMRPQSGIAKSVKKREN